MTAWLAGWAVILGLAAPGWTGVPISAGPAVSPLAGPVRLIGPEVGYGTRALVPPPADRWLAEDKGRHFAMSFAVTGMGYGAARMALDPAPARSAAAGFAMLLGIGKEIVDAHQSEMFSLKDLVWDAAGVALGYTFVQQIE